MCRRFFAVALALLLSMNALAAPQGTERKAIDTKSAVQVIVFAGLGGAVFGLSTLSFYDQPHRHLRNISMAAAVAVVVATIFVTAKAAMGQPPSVNFDDDKQSFLLTPQERHALSFHPTITGHQAPTVSDNPTFAKHEALTPPPALTFSLLTVVF